MAKPYDYDCSCGHDNEQGYKGRFSDVLLNGEMHDAFEGIRHLTDYPSRTTVTPVSKHRGALWLDQRTNQLYTWVGIGYKHDRVRNGWLPVFSDKFQLFDEMLSDVPSSSPVLGQLWLYNGVLMYFDGSSWKPVKALEHSDSQFNTAMFSDFQVFSPLNRIGSSVVSDLELAAFMELQQRYFEGDVDIKEHSSMSLDPRWGWGDLWKHDGVIDFDLEELSYQYLVPNMKVDKIFMDDRLDTNYVLENNCVIQYKRSYLIDEQPRYDDNTPMIAHVKQPSLVHINPGKLTKITKRLFKIDRINPRISCPALNTEFYAYSKGDIRGHFLMPAKDVSQALTEHKQLMQSLTDKNKEALNEKLKEYGYDIDALFIEHLDSDNGDYEILNGGITLSSQAAQNYDYVLAVTYEFSWMNSTGMLRQGDNRTGSCSFFLPNRIGSANIFINGFDYESNYYSWDSYNQVLTVAEDISDKDKFDISVLNVFAHEYGYIRNINITTDKRSAHISTIHKFLRPLIFVNGEVLCRSDWQYYDRNSLKETDKPGNTFTIPGVHRNMCWTVIDMQKEDPVYNEDGVKVDSTITDICIEDNGRIPHVNFAIDSFGNPAIALPKDYKPAYEDYPDIIQYKIPKVVLFVNGLMIKREDIRYDIHSHVITCEGLQPDMTYVILDDRQGNLYTEEMEDGICSALSVGKIDESMVYYNGYLLNEVSSWYSTSEEGLAAANAMHGEVKAFNNGTIWKVFNAEAADSNNVYGIWEDLDITEGEAIKACSNSYVNTKTAVSLNEIVPRSKDDELVVFGYKLSNYIENPLTPVTCWLHLNDGGRAFLKEAGYSEAYARVVKADSTSANSVYLTKIDPSNPEAISIYKDRVKSYYQFMMRAFRLWQEERNIHEFTDDRPVIDQLVDIYVEDSYKHPDEYADYLKGYFYDGVYMRTKADEDTYLELREIAYGLPWVNKVFIGKNFDPISDYVMVWLNGVRQYPDINYVISAEYTEGDILKGYNIILGHVNNDTIEETVDSNGYVTVPRGTGHSVNEAFNKEPLTGILTYVIQRTENGESKACRYTILDHSNMVEGSQNVYTTKTRMPDYVDNESFTRDTTYDFSMFPGNVTVYADGIRLPKSAYTILDAYTLVINDTQSWTGGSRYPEEQYLDINNNVRTRRHLRPEEILVEVRENSQWTERTFNIPKSFSGDISLFTMETSVPANMLETQDTIMIFIDGLYHGLIPNDGYILNKVSGTLSIRDGTVINALRINDIETYLSLNPSLEKIYRKELNAYRKRQSNKLHQVTIEWR